jgi:[pyruvate, water dikinase]-phosphate phosphotransferase / [pyruvate, water dikinase] kinase
MDKIPESAALNLHLVSDATGETINAVSRACLVQFEGVKVEEFIWNLVRTSRQLRGVLDGIRQKPGLVLYTFIDDALRRELEEHCNNYQIPCLSILDPVLQSMANFFGRSYAHQPGRQHLMDAAYFARIAAMDYAMALDDGQSTDHLNEADVIILGVSRTSKTPTCLYLANRGLRAANIPIVPGAALPEGLEKRRGIFATKLMIGLTKEPDTLVEIRMARIKLLHGDKNADYVDPEKVRAEVQAARRLFGRLECPVIDVTRRSIEETAAEIMMLYSQQRLQPAAADT